VGNAWEQPGRSPGVPVALVIPCEKIAEGDLLSRPVAGESGPAAPGWISGLAYRSFSSLALTQAEDS